MLEDTGKGAREMTAADQYARIEECLKNIQSATLEEIREILAEVMRVQLAYLNQEKAMSF